MKAVIIGCGRVGAGLADQLDRDYDEFELETESSVRFYQIIARYSF